MTPASPTQLAGLADSVENLTGPDREVDAEIARAVGWQQRCWSGFGIGAPHWWLDGRTGREIIGLAEGHEHGTLPYFTASLDAAMTLVPEGCYVQLGTDQARHSWAAVTLPDGIDGDELDDALMHHGEAATPALALLTAALRSHIQESNRSALSAETGER